MNGWDAKMEFKCGTNSVVTGMYSQHNNGKEDRRWKVRCSTLDSGKQRKHPSLSNQCINMVCFTRFLNSLSAIVIKFNLLNEWRNIHTSWHYCDTSLPCVNISPFSYNNISIICLDHSDIPEIDIEVLIWPKRDIGPILFMKIYQRLSILHEIIFQYGRK